MKVRDIMDCYFCVCAEDDTVVSVAQQLTCKDQSYVIVLDRSHRYRGVVTSNVLLKQISLQNGKKIISDLVQDAEPVLESTPVSELRKADLEIIPVIDPKSNVLGVVSLRSLLEYLPALEDKSARSGGKDRKNTAKYSINDIIGHSETTVRLKEQIILAAKTKSTVLISGETGTGKELAAHSIHKLSNRRHQPFVRINCAAIPENLLESELFGYEAGAFTGAVKSGHPGKFEMANGGTLFLDEVGDMPLSLQPKILRFLQEKEIEKIGGRSPVQLDVRVIAATHCNLREFVRAGKFREDLFYRLFVIPINMAPLREHREDIPLLIEHFLKRITEDLERSKPRITDEFLDHLMQYDWPGNVRELGNVLEVAVGLSDAVIDAGHVKDCIHLSMSLPSCDEEDKGSLKFLAEEAQRDAIVKAIEMFRGNIQKAAEHLGISKSSIYSKIKKYGIDFFSVSSVR
ncbi:MAG TPA: sigma 54-interacting transcriptional regulator [Syntrophales bacterium]|nr:sigma 54-interacting transcriptional regulator [Syntrophales bacterium]